MIDDQLLTRILEPKIGGHIGDLSLVHGSWSIRESIRESFSLAHGNNNCNFDGLLKKLVFSFVCFDEINVCTPFSVKIQLYRYDKYIERIFPI